MSQNEIIAKRLSELRKEKGVKQDEIANILNVKRATVANYETGKRAPDYETIIKLADYYDVSCDYIIRGVKSEFAETHSLTGLSNEAIEVLQKLVKQSAGEYISEKHKKNIEDLTNCINNPSKEELEKQRKVYDKIYNERKNNKDTSFPDDAYYKTFDEWLFNDEKCELDIAVKENKKEAQIVIETLNYIIEKKDFSKFMTMMYVYLFADVDTSKGVLTGVVSRGINDNDGEFMITFDKELLNESYLLRINNYLNDWKNRGKVKIFDLETYDFETEEQDGENNVNNP